jgi:RimJ/RimL family protein N-acetyltransferase
MPQVHFAAPPSGAIGWAVGMVVRCSMCPDMAKQLLPHPTLVTPACACASFAPRMWRRCSDCFANPEAMRFWNTPVHTKLIETEGAVRRFIHCTPSYYRFWAVADAGTDRCLGMVNSHDRHIRNKRVAIGNTIDPPCHRQGIATDAVSAMLRYSFGELGLHRVEAFIHLHNMPSRAWVEKLGFRCEGLLR